VEVLGIIGRGGMGEVYRARDTKLKRDVAIKTLPDEFSHDVDRLNRFQREAEVLASLNHPNIAAIYDLQEADGARFLVLELVEGETLAERIQRGPIPIEEALQIARRICEALEAAHEQGIVHRDLKPANIKITPDDKVKVLDFGLAKAMESTPTTGVSNSPTLLSAARSNAGLILGTAAYMSPEQAKGKQVDRTTDVWAFGCVLYEILTGRAVFEGETTGEILGGIFKAEPDWRRLPAETPESIRRLLRRCLEKERSLRLHDIADARIEIHDAQNGPQASPAAQWPRFRRRLIAVGSALVILTLVASFALVRAFHPVPQALEMRLEISTPPTASPETLAISPDGQKIVFVAASEGQSRLWVRSLDSVSARALTGTDGASFPFWSPDSRSLGFFADGKLKRIDVDSASVLILTDAVNGGRGGSWNRDGTIIFTPSAANTPIFRISAAGGAPSAITRTNGNETNHRFPYFLPDGNHFLYYVVGAPESHGIYVSDLNGSAARRLLDVDSAPVYSSTGQLLFVRQGTLFAQDFDTKRMELKGSPSPIADRIAAAGTAQGSVAVSASMTGQLIYRSASGGGRRQVVWFDRLGKELTKVGEPTGATELSISPDGRRASLTQQVNQNFDLWLLDLERGVLSRFTSDPAVDNYATWSPDSRRIAFESNRKGAYDLYQKPAAAAGNEELLLASPNTKGPTDWSPDGRFLLYMDADPKNGSSDLWALPLETDRKPFPVTQTSFNERSGQFTPDGRWIAYESDESGRYEIYIQPFPGPGGRVQVSTNGGAQARWRRDGKELFYIALDNRLMGVPIRLASNSQTIDAGAPVPLFTTHIGGAISVPNKQQYDVSPDGQRFLMNTIIEETALPITVILNWHPSKP
jgi:Tol biopolymer transport system component